jgi:D-sedoheptulose 7-phosphate isomerase
MNRAVFLDRDGIVNNVIFREGRPGSPRSLGEFQVKPECVELVKKLRENRFKIFIVTNQPDVGDGLCSEAEVDRMHKFIADQIGIDGIAACYSHDNSDPRRKPNPKMITDIIESESIDPNQSYMVGDSIKDVGAGKNAGITTILLQTEYNIDAHGSADYNCLTFTEMATVITESFVSKYLNQTKNIIDKLNHQDIDRVAQTIAATRDCGGRLFIIGSGGGAGHASHAACDFRKICNLETYVPTDNISELTARINDEGWSSCISEYLKVSRLKSSDCLLVFSVGGGSVKGNISPNLVSAMKLAKEVGAKICGIVGRDGGYAKEVGDACVVIPTVDNQLITPHTEGFQALVWHLLVSHPILQINKTKWESVTK